ncbi:alpha/beta hydrolase [Pseudoduganella sp. SL102]|uniref:alpha/beta hydrolase n=1 Tax=Pseudoduganella sp. SL102 TaxID=2995154 RepID=UPI00248AD9F2|nr:alpha/beta hydrolase [Pseudoduganella sp. SL102]WBS01161.1 alpha/beta hydrolase [Pseudoduganella sp. SL102]
MHTPITIAAPACLLFSLALVMFDAKAQERPGSASAVLTRQDSQALSADTRIGDMLRHPAFAGFGPLLLPWVGREVDETLPLKDAGKLMPYHTHVDPATVVSALNRMIGDANAGKTVFYHFYSEAQRRADPELAQTGLFFLRGKPGAPFAVIAPGGGFEYVGSLHEGFPYAAEIARRCYNAFVLRYRVGAGGSKANEDLAAALTYIFRHAAELGVDTRGYSLWGSSAGARMAAAIGSHGAARFGGAALPKPATVVMAYTGHSDLAASEPPTFVVVGEHDRIAPPEVMRRRVAALEKQGTAVEFRVYPGIAHGFGTGVGTSAEGWIGDAMQFWRKAIR